MVVVCVDLWLWVVYAGGVSVPEEGEFQCSVLRHVIMAGGRVYRCIIVGHRWMRGWRVRRVVRHAMRRGVILGGSSIRLRSGMRNRERGHARQV